jgi:AcrR family transcriptional regulator
MASDSKHEAIIFAARQEFARNGFHDAVVSDIARAAGVGKGTVYRRFGNKERLFAALIKNGSQELLRRIEAAVRSGNTPLETLQNCVDVYFEFFRHSREIIEIVVTEGKQRVGRVHSELMQNDARTRGHLSAIFRSGMDQGFFRPHDPDKLALLLHSALLSLMRWAVLSNESIEPLRNHLLYVFLHGICYPEVLHESLQ